MSVSHHTDRTFLPAGAVPETHQESLNDPTLAHTSLLSDYKAITSSVGILEQSSLSKIRLIGRDGLDLLQRISTNDFSKVTAASIINTILLTEKAKIVDLVRVFNAPDSSIILLSNAPSGTILAWISKFIIMEDVELRDESEYYSVLTVVGPVSRNLLGWMTGSPLSEESWHSAIEVDTTRHRLWILPSEHSYKNRIDLLIDTAGRDALLDHLFSFPGNGGPTSLRRASP